MNEFFFFKQKTAYEMRISDWSSDVCSSDLSLHHPLERPGLRYPVAEMTDSVFVRGAITECKTQKPHPTQPIPNHILRSRIGQIMLGLQNQDLEHHDRVKRRTAALAAIGITQSFDQPDPEIDRKSKRLNSSH